MGDRTVSAVGKVFVHQNRHTKSTKYDVSGVELQSVLQNLHLKRLKV